MSFCVVNIADSYLKKQVTKATFEMQLRHRLPLFNSNLTEPSTKLASFAVINAFFHND
jgi:hypothetical protein